MASKAAVIYGTVALALIGVIAGNECETQSGEDMCNRHNTSDQYCFCSWLGDDGCKMACQDAPPPPSDPETGSGNECEAQTQSGEDMCNRHNTSDTECFCGWMDGSCHMGCYGEQPPPPEVQPCVAISRAMVEDLRSRGIMPRTCEEGRRLRRLKGLNPGPPCPQKSLQGLKVLKGLHGLHRLHGLKGLKGFKGFKGFMGLKDAKSTDRSLRGLSNGAQAPKPLFHV